MEGTGRGVLEKLRYPISMPSTPSHAISRVPALMPMMPCRSANCAHFAILTVSRDRDQSWLMAILRDVCLAEYARRSALSRPMWKRYARAAVSVVARRTGIAEGRGGARKMPMPSGRWWRHYQRCFGKSSYCAKSKIFLSRDRPGDQGSYRDGDVTSGSRRSMLRAAWCRPENNDKVAGAIGGLER